MTDQTRTPASSPPALSNPPDAASSAEPQAQGDLHPNAGNRAPERKETQELGDLPAWAQEVIRDLRSEAADRRREAKRVKEAAERAEQERLVTQGEFKSAYEKVVSELEPLKARIERAEQLEAYMAEAVKARVEALPEAYRKLVPRYEDPLQTLQWLEESSAVLVPPRAPSLDAGVRGTSGASALSAEEQALARRMGLTDAQYQASKAAMGGRG